MKRSESDEAWSWGGKGKQPDTILRSIQTPALVGL
jgi:hypothetical protein